MAARVAHQTTAANAVSVVTLTSAWNTVEVVNRGTTELFVRTDGTAPTVGGDDCDVVPGSSAISLPVLVNAANDPGSRQPGRTTTTVVQVTSSAAVAFTVSGF